jgi:hypothetical protein
MSNQQKLTNYTTTNKSDRDLNIDFDDKNLNKKFLKEDKKRNQETEQEMIHEIKTKLLPHQKPFEDIIVNIRDILYYSLELLAEKKNPIPFLFSTPDRFFSFSIFLLILGTMLLLFSNLMITNKNIN